MKEALQNLLACQFQPSLVNETVIMEKYAMTAEQIKRQK